ncbi:Speckle targeted PIP5K1A-regulated poly(A) polymerase [Strongyloides ratti]|uniref:Speckle targeted PIP5K1A-regulated poly(A) polymerase n=1 Tax=Strongyloides ratti TaxID=34506 RepID=A0A090L6L7_STRRB|nr:Speckle targeted PIP5K1A-regulated poly(A) polymerase [Strongyloides ratti]CEF63139.1 Speckle targeted PIP5K1A-regulated poly(A) polymerase [Strongyloides ratti]
MHYSCEVCHVSCHSEASLNAHYGGKKHAENVKEERFQREIEYGTEWLEEIKFKDASSAERFLKNGNFQLNGHEIIVEKRKVSFSSIIKRLKYADIDINTIEELLENENDFEKQIEILVNSLTMDKEKIQRRLNIINELATCVQKYFIPSLNIQVFGSLISGLSTKYSDVDGTLLFAEKFDGNKVNNNNIVYRNAETLLALDPQMFLQNGITLQEFSLLSVQNRVRLLCKIISHIKKTIGIVTQISFILNKKVPILQIAIRNKFILDLSCDNQLGVVKFNWFADIIKFDTTGRVFKFIFALRLWSSTTNLLRGKNSQENSGYFTSYSITLMAIFYLRNKNFIPSNVVNNSLIVNGFNCGYKVSPYQFPDVTMSFLFRDFFTFIATKFNPKLIMCLPIEKILSIKEFNDYYNFDEDTQKKFSSAVNIQDPLEITHNIGQRVTFKYWRKMKTNMLLSIAKIKARENFLSILKIKGHNDSHEHNETMTDICEEGEELKKLCEVDVPTTLPQEVFYSLLNEILEQIVLLDSVFDDTYMDDSREVAGITGNDGHWVRLFATSTPVWIGRRKIRRHIETIDGEKTLSLEKRVTKKIMEERNKSFEMCPSEVITVFKLEGCYETGKYKIFYAKDPDLHHEQEKFLSDILHFLQYFIPNVMSKTLTEIDIETDLRSKSFYEDTSNLPASPNKSSSHALNHNYEHGSPTVKEKTSFNFLEPPPATQYNRFIPKSPPCLEGSLAPQYNTEHPEKYMNKSEKQLQEYPVNHQLDYNQPLNHQLVNNQQMNNQQMNDQPINKPPAKRQALLIPAPPKPLSPIEIVVPKEPYHIPPVNHPNYIDNIQKDAPNIPIKNILKILLRF